MIKPRDMENISRGSTFGEFATILTEGSMQDVKVKDYRVHKEYGLPSPPSFKCNVLRESLSVDSQNIPCATLKQKGVMVKLYIRVSLTKTNFRKTLPVGQLPTNSVIIYRIF
jgi:hypothetical protein